MPSFIIIGYVRQSLERRGFLPPPPPQHTWAVPKSPFSIGLMFPSREVKDPIILDPCKKMTQYQNIHVWNRIYFISQVIGGLESLNMSLVIFGDIQFLTLNIAVTITDRFLIWILIALSFSRRFSKVKNLPFYTIFSVRSWMRFILLLKDFNPSFK